MVNNNFVASNLILIDRKLYIFTMSERVKILKHEMGFSLDSISILFTVMSLQLNIFYKVAVARNLILLQILYFVQ